MKIDPLTPVSQRETNFIAIWWMAARPKALAISCVTVAVGTLLAQSTIGFFSWTIALFALLFSIFIQIGTHFINDALDFEKGVDTTERLGFPKVTKLGLVSSRYMLVRGFSCLAIAFLCGIPLILQGGWPFLIILLVCVANGYLYTGGPMPLSYSGLGDLFAFLFYGLVGTLTVYSLQTGYIDSKVLLAGTQVGLLATVMTAINNLRDIVSDAKAHKRTLAVRFGKTFARIEISCLILTPFILSLLWIGFGYPFSAFLPYCTLPLASRILKSIWQTEPNSQYNQFFVSCIIFQVLFGFLLCIGYALK